MSHRAETGMHDLVIHRKNKDVLEMPRHQRAKLRLGLTVDMARLARRRGTDLRLERGHADDDRTMRLERLDNAVHDPIFIALRNMLQHIERKDAVMATREWFLADIADDSFEGPRLLHARLCVLN